MTAIRLPQNTMRHVPPAMPPANVTIRRRMTTIHDHETTTRRFIPSMPCYFTVLFLILLSRLASRASAFTCPTLTKLSCRQHALFSSLVPNDSIITTGSVTFNDEHFLNAAAESTLQSCHLHLNTTQLCLQIIKYCTSERAQQVIVGLPLHKNGTEAIQSQRTRAFCTELACLVLAKLGPGIPIYLWDERFTSKEAAARRDTQSGNNHFRTLDAHAACIILETYYAENGKGAERVHVPEDMKQVCWQAWNLRTRGYETSLLASLELTTRGN